MGYGSIRQTGGALSEVVKTTLPCVTGLGMRRLLELDVWVRG